MDEIPTFVDEYPYPRNRYFDEVVEEGLSSTVDQILGTNGSWRVFGEESLYEVRPDVEGVDRILVGRLKHKEKKDSLLFGIERASPSRISDMERAGVEVMDTRNEVLSNLLGISRDEIKERLKGGSLTR